MKYRIVPFYDQIKKWWIIEQSETGTFWWRFKCYYHTYEAAEKDLNLIKQSQT